MEGTVVKTSNGWQPACKEAQKIWDRMIIGARCKIEQIRGRNYDNHKRFFQFRDETFDIQDQFEDREVWRKHLLLMAGHYEEQIRVMSPNMVWILNYLEKYLMGSTETKNKVICEIKRSYEVVLVPMSMAWDKVDEDEFIEIFARALNGFLSNYAPEMSDAQFMHILDFE